MKLSKRIQNFLGLIGFGLFFYILFSFVIWDFNCVNWEMGIRFLYVFFWQFAYGIHVAVLYEIIEM